MTADTTGENCAPTLLTFFNKQGKRSSRVKRSPDEMSRASRGADTCVSGLTMGQQSYAADLMNQKTTRNDQRKEEAMEDAFEILKQKEIEHNLSKEESQQLFVQIFQQLLEERKSNFEEEDRIQDLRFKDAFESLVEERTHKSKSPGGGKSLFRPSSSSPESPSASSTTDHFLVPSPKQRSPVAKSVQVPTKAPNSPASIGTADIFAAFALPETPALDTDSKNATANKPENKVRRGKKQKPTTKVVRRVRRVKVKKNTDDKVTESRDEVEEKKSPQVQQRGHSSLVKEEPSRTTSSDTLEAVKNYSSKQLVANDKLQTQAIADDPNLTKTKSGKNGLSTRNPKKDVITQKKTKIQTAKEDVRKVMERIMSSDTLPTASLSTTEEEPPSIEGKPRRNDTTAKTKRKKSRSRDKEGKSSSRNKESSSRGKSKGRTKDKQSTTTRKPSNPTNSHSRQDEAEIREGKRPMEKPKRRKASSSRDRHSSTKDSSNDSSKIRKKTSSSSRATKAKEMDTTEESKKSKRRTSSSGKKSSSSHHRRRQRSRDEIP